MITIQERVEDVKNLLIMQKGFCKLYKVDDAFKALSKTEEREKMTN